MFHTHHYISWDKTISGAAISNIRYVVGGKISFVKQIIFS